MSSWPNKPIAQFTNEELADAIERHQDSTDQVIRDMVTGCWRELERRHGLPVRD